MLEKIGIFCGKCFEKLFFQHIPWNFSRKITIRGKNVQKNWPLDTWATLGIQGPEAA
jgi:hypothetical protein